MAACSTRFLCATMRLDTMPRTSWTLAQIRAEDIIIDYNNMIGDGTYGEVFEGKIIGGEHAGIKIVAKRAKDWEGGTRTCSHLRLLDTHPSIPRHFHMRHAGDIFIRHASDMRHAGDI